MKILLDAGHFGDYYNQSPANKAYYESATMWKLHKHLGTALKTYGIEVDYTRSDQSKDLSVTTRGTMAKGYDLLLSLHSNAVGECVDEAVDHPVVFVPLNGKGNAIGQKLADTIHKIMGTKENGRIVTREGKSGDYYAVIREAVSVGVVGMILEHSFHTQTSATNWLLSDANLKRLAETEAATIAEHYGLLQKPGSPITPTAPPVLRYETASGIDSMNKYGIITVPSYWQGVAVETAEKTVRGDYAAGLIRNFDRITTQLETRIAELEAKLAAK